MKKLWIIEIWDEEREVFKSIIGHAACFLIAIGTFVCVDYIIDIGSLHEDSKATFKKIDFWFITISLVMLGTTFICKLVILSVKKIRDDIRRIH
jgi:hypothetical protein